VALAAAALLLVGCAGSSGAGQQRSTAGGTAGTGASDAPTSGSLTSTPVTGALTVSAAASLTETFNRIKQEFTALHPDVSVNISYAGSDSLAAQINAGAPVDVFAAASTTTMNTVVSAGNIDGTPTRFATNSLEIAVPPDNPAGISGLSDLVKDGVKLAVCAPTVPCGAASTTVFRTAGLTPTPVSLETDVKSVLTKVETGEVDAGLVYRTDVHAAGSGVRGITFPEASSAVTDYPIGVVRDAPNGTAARAFVDYVLSDRGRAALSDAGFGAP